MSPSRRAVLKLGLAAGAGALLRPLRALAREQQALVTKPIPSSGEQVPVIGLGSSGTFDLEPQDTDWAPGREVIRLFHQAGGKVIDTSPTYQRSEIFLGQAVRDFGIQNDLFLATKVNVGDSGREAALRQMQTSAERFGKPTIDLMQVWNLGDSIRNLTDRFIDEHMEVVTQWKAEGRTRYIGITTSRDPQYEDVEAAMRRYTMDFVQLDYSIEDRNAQQVLLPLAAERGIAVIVNRPFSRGQLFRRVRGRELPGFAAELGITTWAQYFLKFVVSHPSVTVAIPATGDPEHLVDNMGACTGPMPDEAMRARMVSAFEGL